nr:hypothetical protein Iba_chr12fCG8710 [Ipomoea batatas]
MFSRNNGTKDEDDDTIGSLFSRQCRSHYHPADQKAVRKRRGAEEKDAEAGTPEEFMVGHAVGAINIPTCSKLDQDDCEVQTPDPGIGRAEESKPISINVLNIQGHTFISFLYHIVLTSPTHLHSTNTILSQFASQPSFPVRRLGELEERLIDRGLRLKDRIGCKPDRVIGASGRSQKEFGELIHEIKSLRSPTDICI